MIKRRNFYLAAFALLHIVIFLVIFKGGIYRGFSENDISIPYLYGSKIALGQIPYRDFAVEYPPLALLFMLIPRLFSSYAQPYILGFTLEILFFDLLAMLLIAALSRRLGLTMWKTLGVYTLALLAIGPLIINRYDLIPAVITLAAIYAFVRGNTKIAWVLLAAGTMTKIFPVVVVPIFLIYDLLRHNYHRVIQGASAFIITLAVIALPFIILSPGGFWESFTYQAQRGLQIESVLASLLLLGQKLGLTTLSVEQASGGTNVVSPLANALATITPVLVLLALAWVFWLYYRWQRNALNTHEASTVVQQSQAAGLITFSMLAVLAFLLADKVLSPQFLIWLLPFIPLMMGRYSRVAWLLFIAAGLLSYLIFPTGYLSLEEGDPRMIAMLLVRNAALIGLAFAAGRSILRTEEKAGLQAETV